MSTEQIPVSRPYVGGKTTPQHPLGPLTAGEISESARLIKSLWPSNTNIQFKVITLKEPNKTELVPFLAAEHAGGSTPTIERKSFVVYYIRNTVRFSPSFSSAKISGLTQQSQDKLHEAIVSLSLGKVERNVRLGPNVHSNADGDEIVNVERIALEDEQVKAEIAKLKLPEGTVVISDPWIYGMGQFSMHIINH
jgi:primary-amine oxidase